MTPKHVAAVLSLMARCKRSDELAARLTSREDMFKQLLRQHDDMIDFARAALVQATRPEGDGSGSPGTEEARNSSPTLIPCRGAHLEGGS